MDRWFLEMDLGRDAGSLVATVLIVDSDGCYASKAVAYYDIGNEPTHEWVARCADVLDVQRAAALDQFTGWCLEQGMTREQALSAREDVINTEALPERCWPTWECMTDAQRHQAWCAVLGVPDPLAVS